MHSQGPQSIFSIGEHRVRNVTLFGFTVSPKLDALLMTPSLPMVGKHTLEIRNVHTLTF